MGLAPKGHNRRRLWAYLVMVLIGVAPMVSVMLAGLIATQNGCGLHEGFAQPCVVFGTDIGGILYTMGVMGWLMLVSIFFLAGGVLGLVCEGVLAIIKKLWRR